MPACGTWFGAAPRVGAPMRPDRGLADFERTVGRRMDIMHVYARDGELFPNAWQIAVARDRRRPRMLLVNWKPDTGRSWAQVAAGDPVINARIDRLSRHIKRYFDQRFFLTIHHEPEEEVRPQRGSGYTAADYRAMYRYVVQRLRHNGLDKVVTVMNYQGWPRYGVQPWFKDLYPGDDVVDWLAFSPFVFGKAIAFADLMNYREPQYPGWPGFYTWTAQNMPDKPLMVAEWGVFERRKEPGHKPWFYGWVGRQIEDFPRIKAMVYFDGADVVGGDSRVDSNPGSLEAFRILAQLPHFNATRVPRR
ncbi:hypothetical protein DPM19_15250 [Actinomadura craniellae]|uniref:GH26 domain-containing protein n=1 Tax=Actinomadura craniellae TaxID=2231787 RepID=A0A365H5F4_9ACTN|nr:hypothetical protein DPM19_15250 [Actinomadura craniellae]